MIYQFLKYVVALSLRIFFKRFVVNKSYDLPTSGPLLIVGNHPNTLMDPYILATLFKQKVGFLGNASLFVNKLVSAFLGYFQVIPVYRPQDVGEGVKPDNRKTFAACYEHLEKGRAIMIFPEGTSFGDLKLRKIKTGTARIALGAQEKNDFMLNLNIIPIGLYYSSPTRFRSKVYVNVGEMIETKHWRDAFEKDEFYAVQELTKEIRTSLEQLTITAEDSEQEELFHKIKRIYKSTLQETYNKAKDKREEFRLTQEISKAIEYFRSMFPVRFEQLKSKIEDCTSKMDQFNSPSELTARKRIAFLKLLYAIPGFPIYLYGYLQNFLPLRIPRWAAEKITKEQEYHAPISLTLGIFLFPIFYTVFCVLFSSYASDYWLHILIYFGSLPLAGFYALHYYHFIKTYQAELKTLFSTRTTKNSLVQLLSLQEEIKMELNQATQEYLNRL